MKKQKTIQYSCPICSGNLSFKQFSNHLLDCGNHRKNKIEKNKTIENNSEKNNDGVGDCGDYGYYNNEDSTYFNGYDDQDIGGAGVGEGEKGNTSTTVNWTDENWIENEFNNSKENNQVEEDDDENDLGVLNENANIIKGDKMCKDDDFDEYFDENTKIDKYSHKEQGLDDEIDEDLAEKEFKNSTSYQNDELEFEIENNEEDFDDDAEDDDILDDSIYLIVSNAKTSSTESATNLHIDFNVANFVQREKNKKNGVDRLLKLHSFFKNGRALSTDLFLNSKLEIPRISVEGGMFILVPNFNGNIHNPIGAIHKRFLRVVKDEPKYKVITKKIVVGPLLDKTCQIGAICEGFSKYRPFTSFLNTCHPSHTNFLSHFRYCG
jgi:hypothetical protein